MFAVFLYFVTVLFLLWLFTPSCSCSLPPSTLLTCAVPVDGYTIRQLKTLGRVVGLPGYGRMTKEELIQALS